MFTIGATQPSCIPSLLRSNAVGWPAFSMDMHSLHESTHFAQMASWVLASRAPRFELAQDALAAAWCRSSQQARALVAWENVIHKLHAVRLSLATGAP